VTPGARVVLKINQVGGLSIERGSTVHPELVGLVAAMIKAAGAGEVIVADDVGRFWDSLKIFDEFGTTAIAESVGARVMDLKREPHAMTKTATALLVPELEYSVPLRDCDVLIGLTKLKTHHQAGMTAAIKNMFGAVPDYFKRFCHRHDIDKALVDILSIRRPDFTIVDGFPAMEALGPHAGSPVPINITIAGRDPVAVDAVCASVMGFAPDWFRTVKMAGAQGLGCADLSQIEVKGLQLAEVRRSFQNSLLPIQESVRGYIEIHDKSICSGCPGVVGTVFMLLQRQGSDLEALRGTRVYAGAHETIPDADDPRVYLVGDCIKGYREHPRFIPGCPPNITEAMTFISPADTPATLFGRDSLPSR
jgi:uncharacterized protein (DUF362 family)